MVAVFAIPNPTIDLIRLAFAFDNQSPGALLPPGRMRHVTGQKEHFAGPERNNLALACLGYIITVELDLKLEKNFFSLINVKLLAGIDPMDHRNKIGLPRRSTGPRFPDFLRSIV
jgi:hypothetical protein